MTVDNFPTARPAVTLDFRKSRKLNPRINFTRASAGGFIGTGSGNVNGEVHTFPENVPRLTNQGLLIEGSRTNSFLNSVFTQTADWLTSNPADHGTVTANQAVAPDGTNTAAALTAGQQRDRVVSMPMNTTNDQTVFSIFVKRGTGDLLQIGSLDWINQGAIDYTFSTDTWGQNFNLAGFGKEEYGNDWVRFWVRFGAAGNGTVYVRWGDASPSGTVGWFWGVQQEQGRFPTSYIPTAGATVTRAADICDILPAEFNTFFNTTESTVVVDSLVDWSWAHVGNDNYRTFLAHEINQDGTNRDTAQLSLMYRASSDEGSGQAQPGVTWRDGLSDAELNQTAKMAITINTNNQTATGSLNGRTPSTLNGNNTVEDAQSIRLGGLTGGNERVGRDQLFGYIQGVRIYATDLTQDNLNSLTATTTATLAAASVTVTSTSFNNGAAIGNDYYYDQNGCPGNNRSPQLSWSINNMPAGRSVSSWRLRCTDDDANNFVHWSVNDIEANDTSIDENGAWSGNPTVNATGFSPDPVRANGWGGPCPPNQHTYRIVITAVLDNNTIVQSPALTFTAS